MRNLKKKRKIDLWWSNPELAQLQENVSLSAEEKLKRLEKLNQFVRFITPAKSKKLWEKLKEKGW